MIGHDDRPTRLRSGHRRFSQDRADRRRFLGSLLVDALALVGAAIWTATGRWEVGLAWACAALLSAGATCWGRARPSAASTRWALRGDLAPASVAAVLLMGGVILVTMRFGLGQEWTYSLVLPGSTTVMVLGSSWWSGRRSRRQLEQRRAELRTGISAPGLEGCRSGPRPRC